MSEKNQKINGRKPTGNLNNKGKGKKPSAGFYWIYIMIAAALLILSLWGFDAPISEVHKVDLSQMIERGDVEKINIVKNKEIANIYIKKDCINNDDSYKEAFKNHKEGPHFFYRFGDIEQINDLINKAEERHLDKLILGKDAEEADEIKENFTYVDISYDNSKSIGWEGISFIVFVVLLIVFWVMFSRSIGGRGGNQVFGFGKSNATLYDNDTQVNITFNDVAGLDGAKEEVVEIVDFLKNPKKYTALGGKIPKGALLVGPPGTGKTLLAKAVAGEAKVPFFSLSGSDFVEMFVGVGASRVRDLFKTAKEKAPCIIFIDEIDAIGRARGRNSFTGTNDERENTLNQLLTEMDGFSTNVGVIILAATNRVDVLDRALLRAGRFDRQIHVELPDVDERKDIFGVHIRPLKLSKNVDLEFFAKQTPGFSGADIANVCNEAALIAARKNKKEIDKQDFLDAIDRIIGGLERRSKIISPSEKRVIAFHESGHATVSWMLKYAAPLLKVTIVPRGKSLGAAWYTPEERQITSQEQLLDEMAATLGGRAAEEVVFGTVSTGALNDLERVTKQAYAMVAYYGLNSKVGNLSYYDSTGQSEYAFNRPYSEKTAQTIDEEVHTMVENAYQRAKAILLEHKDKLEILANLLLEKEVIFRDNLVEIFGERPFEQERLQEEGKLPEENKEKNADLQQQENATEEIPEAEPVKAETDEDGSQEENTSEDNNQNTEA